MSLGKCLTCGHHQYDHIYGEGACRPGFACPSACTRFISVLHQETKYEIVRTSNDRMFPYEIRRNGIYVNAYSGGGAFTTKWGARRAILRLIKGKPGPRVVETYTVKIKPKDS